jgi:hypothetical protein
MSIKLSFAGAMVAAATLLMSAPASALDFKAWDPTVAPEGYGDNKVVHHWIYRPNYRHVYHTSGDPYAYRYAPRAYYPYHASPYWVPAEQMRNRYRYTYTGPKYRYHAPWGAGRSAHAPAVDAKPTK